MSSSLPLLPGLRAHSSGALWIEASQTVIIADVHLGFSWAQRRRGELGPLVDGGTRHKLHRVLDEFHPARTVFLGDLVHAPRPCEPERAYIDAILNELSQRTELVAVRGNHDRAFPREFAHAPVQHLDLWSEPGLHAIHGNALPSAIPPGITLVMGHLHPALPVHDAAGASRKLPVFLAGKQCIVLPAFSPFAGGYDLLSGLPSDLAALARDLSVFALTPARALALGGLAELTERMLDSPQGRPAEFRRRLAKTR